MSSIFSQENLSVVEVISTVVNLKCLVRISGELGVPYRCLAVSVSLQDSLFSFTLFLWNEVKCE